MDDDQTTTYDAALRRLPLTYALALRLLDAGVDDDEMCGYLDIEPEGLPTLLDLARRKLAAELQDH